MITLTDTTPSGGIHAFFRTPEKFPSKTIAEGVDIKTAGGYVVIPPSSGYLTRPGVTNIREIPEWIATKARAAPKATGIKGSKHPTPNPPPVIVTASSSVIRDHELTRLLNLIDPSLPYEAWRDVIFATINLHGPTKLTEEHLLKWSQCSAKFEQAAFDKVVRSYIPGHTRQLGSATLHHAATCFPHCTGAHPTVSSALAAQARDLAERTLRRAIDLLNTHGNHPSTDHTQSLREVCHGLAYGVYSTDSFRLAFPLETGMGKTTCVIALIKELENTHISLLVCAERVEQLEDLRQELAKLGVVAQKVGIFHSSRGPAYDHIKSVQKANLNTVQFLLVSHARAKTDKGTVLTAELLDYKGRKRDLTVWDESLITTSACHIKTDALERACHAWIGVYNRRVLRDGETWAVNHHLLDELRRFIDHFLSNIGVDGVISLAPLSDDADRYAKPIDWLLTSKPDQDCVKELVRYGVLWGKARSAEVASKPTTIQFTPTLSNAFDKVVVLDASARIRLLIRYDPTIKIFPIRRTKSFDNVTLYTGKAMASRHSFDADTKHLVNYIEEAKHIISTRIPADQPVLVFTRKDLENEVVKQLITNARLNVKVLHWGAHRASNGFTEYRYVITIGVLYRDDQELAASIIGQTQQLDSPLNDSQIQHVQHSEMADLLYQAFSRGSCRRTVNGKAESQDIYLLLPEKDLKPILDLLALAMKDVKAVAYRPKHLLPSSQAGLYLTIGNEIERFLGAQPATVDKVSVQKIRDELHSRGLIHVSSNSKSWKKAVEHASKHIVGWQKIRNSFERLTASTSIPPALANAAN